MKLKHLYSVLILFIFCQCSGVSYWTTGSIDHLENPPFAAEVQVTDSSFALYTHNFVGCLRGNSGLCIIDSARFSGDTLLVYDLKHVVSETNQLATHTYIKYAFLRKRDKLYPIYDHYPRLKWNLPFDEDSQDDIDSSGVRSFQVNWKGWNGNQAYINFNGGFHSKGKYEPLREELTNRHASSDTVEWTIGFPKTIINDSTYYREEVRDYLGPLKDNGH